MYSVVKAEGKLDINAMVKVDEVKRRNDILLCTFLPSFLLFSLPSLPFSLILPSVDPNKDLMDGVCSYAPAAKIFATFCVLNVTAWTFIL